MPPLVRTATRDDLPRVVELLAQLAPEVADREDPSRLDMYAEALARTEAQGQRLLVIEDGRRIAGTLASHGIGIS